MTAYGDGSRNLIFRCVFIALALLIFLFPISCKDEKLDEASNQPEQSILDYYQASNNRDCEKMISLRTVRSIKELEKNGLNAVKMCQQMMYENQPMFYVTIDRISENKSNRVEIRYRTKIGNNETNNIATLQLEDKEWKIDEIRP